MQKWNSFLIMNLKDEVNFLTRKITVGVSKIMLGVE